MCRYDFKEFLTDLLGCVIMVSVMLLLLYCLFLHP
jgi:hypothetical protein